MPTKTIAIPATKQDLEEMKDAILQEVNAKFDTLDRRIAGLSGRITKMESKIDEVLTRLPKRP